MSLETGSLAEIATQTGPDVWHCRQRSAYVSRTVIEELKSLATHSNRRRCRLCLHVSPEDREQQMLIAMQREAKDRLHYHPSKIEVIQPLEGEANLIQANQAGETIRSIFISAKETLCFTNLPRSLHYFEILSNWFVFLEISQGPFTKDSTIYLP